MLLAVTHIISTEEHTVPRRTVDSFYVYDQTLKRSSKYLIEVLATMKMMSSLYVTFFYKIILLLN